jgi:nitrogen fixation protein FixH
VGEYIVTITASDGKSQVSKRIKLLIESGNAAPVIGIIPPMTVEVGDTIELDPLVTDADGDDVTISYSGFMTESTAVATEDDVGEQTVTITATDGKSQTLKTVRITVVEKNNAPVLEDLSTIVVTEGDLVTVNAVATDADDDEMTISFSEPVGVDGTWQTIVGDAGTYTVTVTVSDGQLTDEKSVAIVVRPANSAPEIEHDDVTVIVQKDGEATVTLEPTVTDADGDEVTVTYSGFMDSNEKTVNEDDEGEHIVTITADDGKVSTDFNIKVTVEVNSPPEFTI